MRRRSKRVSTWLAAASVAGASLVALATWNVAGDATAQERAASQAGPRDVSRQPLVSSERPAEPVAVADEAVAADIYEGGALAIEVAPAAGEAPRHAGGASMETVTVLVDHAKVVRLPETTQTVIVGNPIVADVTVQRNGILIVTGKSYGSTNLIALDPAGVLLAESMISVQAPTDSVVLVQRGLARESYSCTPTCQPSLRLGDSPDYFGGVGNQATQRNTLATQR